MGEHLYQRRKRVVGYLTVGAQKFSLVTQMNTIFELTHDNFEKWLELGTDVWLDEINLVWDNGNGSGDLFNALNTDIPAAAGYPVGTKIYHTIVSRLVYS